MSTLKLVVVIGFVVAFGAGLVTGMRYHRGAVAVDGNSSQPTTGPATRPTHGPRGGSLDKVLNLTPEQSRQARKIWEAAFTGRREHDEEMRKEARRQRDDGIAALIPQSSRQAYDKVLQDYNDRLQRIDQEGRQAFEKAKTEFIAILTPEQRTKYEEMSREMFGRRGGDRRDQDHGGRGRGDATTRSATQRNTPQVAH